jgi:hypothetical protein
VHISSVYSDNSISYESGSMKGMFNPVAGRTFGLAPGWTGLTSLFLLLLCWCLSANAQQSVTKQDNSQPFATVWRMHGVMTAYSASTAKSRQLREGDPVYVGEKLTTAADSEAVLKTGDAGLIAVRPGAEFVVERYVAEGKSTDQFATRLFTGSLRMITGWIGKLNPAGHRVSTPTATIGIRGTDHEPFVLTAELAAKLSDKEGAYDKVNRGGTRMGVGDFKLDIDPGKVGFARAPATASDRALLTLLMPVLLEKIPDFYVPGRFDAELDEFSSSTGEQAAKLLEKKQQSAAVHPNAEKCSPATTATAWLGQLDASIARGDAASILGMFAPDVKIRATVRGANGQPSTVNLQREELVTSTLAAVKELKDYQQRRLSLDAGSVDGADGCTRIKMKSVVAESGLQAGEPFRFESVEEYVLVQRDGRWLALQAETTQR